MYSQYFVSLLVLFVRTSASARVPITWAYCNRLDAGHSHSGCLSPDGDVVTWGRSTYGRLGYGTHYSGDIGDNEEVQAAGYVNVSVSGAAAVEFAAGGRHSCVLFQTNDVVCYGDAGSGQCGYGDATQVGQSNDPALRGPVNLTSQNYPVLQLVCGVYHCCALFNVSNVVRVKCWGLNSNGQLGLGDATSRGNTIGTIPATYDFIEIDSDNPWLSAIQVDCGEFVTCVLMENGKVKCFGANSWGVLGQNMATGSFIGKADLPSAHGYINVTAENWKVSQICVGKWGFVCALLENGAVVCWGKADEGQLGYGSLEDIGDDEVPASAGYVNISTLYPSAMIACGEYHACALLLNGDVVCWGKGLSFRTGYVTEDNIGDDEEPASVGPITNLPSDDDVVSVHVGTEHTCAIHESGRVSCWGYNGWGMCGRNIVSTKLRSNMSSYIDFGFNVSVQCEARWVSSWSPPTISPTHSPSVSPTPNPTNSPTPTPMSPIPTCDKFSRNCADDNLCDAQSHRCTPCSLGIDQGCACASQSCLNMQCVANRCWDPSTALGAEAIAELTPVEEPEDNTGAIIGGVLGGIAFAILVALLIFFLIMRYQRRHEASRDPFVVPMLPPLTQAADLSPSDVIASSSLKRFEKVGEGSFGVVYRGEYNDKVVAIKELKDESDESKVEFRAEAAKMLSLVPHHNVVRIYGVCEQPLCIVTEFLSGGSLDTLVYDKTKELPDDVLNVIIVGAARGLAHLHAQHVIHRDIAARNVLLDEEMLARIADLGMAREKDDNTYYQQTKTNVGPVRWMAPEQMERRQYSTHSDCYSFGVMLYECYERKRPWDAYDNLQAAGQVMKGARLPSPDAAPKAVKKLMQRLFETKPTSRPSMKSVVYRLEVAFGMKNEEVYEAPPLEVGAGEYSAPPNIGGGGGRGGVGGEGLYGQSPGGVGVYDVPDSSKATTTTSATAAAYSAPPLPPSSSSVSSPRRRAQDRSISSPRSKKKQEKEKEEKKKTKSKKMDASSFSLSAPVEGSFKHVGGHSRE